MFFELARILQAKQPRLFVFENVKGLLSHDSGDTFKTIIQTITELGYDCQWQVINSKNYGVAQNRERVYIIGHLRGTARPKVFPATRQSNTNTTIGESTKTTIARTLTGGGHTGGNHSGMTILKYVGQVCDTDRVGDGKNLSRNAREGYRVYDADGLCPTLRSSLGGASRGSQIIQYKALTEKRTEEAKEIRRSIKEKDYSPRRGKYLSERNDDISNCITATQSKEHLISNRNLIRRLTPIECERLQGFEDNWTQGVSDTQRFKCLGNAVTTNVIESIFTHIL
jgi:DNA (cytosine-5)-methyltransferase 1